MAKKQEQKVAPIYTISHCNVTNTNAPTNEHTRAAVEALARAAEANAVAITEAAKALRGGNVVMENAFKFEA